MSILMDILHKDMMVKASNLYSTRIAPGVAGTAIQVATDIFKEIGHKLAWTLSLLGARSDATRVE